MVLVFQRNLVRPYYFHFLLVILSSLRRENMILLLKLLRNAAGEGEWWPVWDRGFKHDIPCMLRFVPFMAMTAHGRTRRSVVVERCFLVLSWARGHYEYLFIYFLPPCWCFYCLVRLALQVGVLNTVTCACESTKTDSSCVPTSKFEHHRELCIGNCQVPIRRRYAAVYRSIEAQYTGPEYSLLSLSGPQYNGTQQKDSLGN